MGATNAAIMGWLFPNEPAAIHRERGDEKERLFRSRAKQWRRRTVCRRCSPGPSDAGVGVRAAKAAGVATIALLTGLDAVALAQAGAVASIRDFTVSVVCSPVRDFGFDPGPGEQRVELGCGMPGGEPCEDVGEVVLGIDGVEAAGLDQ